MSLDKKNSINNILEEKRIFPPSKKFAENSNISTQEELLSLKKQASDNPIQFWESFAKSELDWFEPFQTVLDNENEPFFEWFKEGKLNITYNCLDRHIKRGLGGKTALIWEGEPGDSKKYTYEELLKEVCKAANALKAIGVKKGDLVCIYMPMIPEAMFAMLACARIGAPHSVVFGGFSSEAFLTSDEPDSSLGPLKILIKTARPMKTAASHPVILLKTFPAPCPPRILLAA